MVHIINQRSIKIQFIAFIAWQPNMALLAVDGFRVPSVAAAISDCITQLGVLGGLAPERRAGVETVG
jgi:hypothetical protein